MAYTYNPDTGGYDYVADDTSSNAADTTTSSTVTTDPATNVFQSTTTNTDSTDGQGGTPVQYNGNWYFPDGHGGYSVNGGSSTISSSDLIKLQRGDAMINPLGSGEQVGSGANAPSGTDESVATGFLNNMTKKAGDALVARYTKPGGSVDWGQLAKDAAFTYMASQSTTPNQGGYNKPIPELAMQRQQINYNDPNRRPGSAGLQYFTDPKYAASGDTNAMAAAKSADDQQAQGIKAAYTPAAAPAANPYAGKTPLAYANPVPVAQPQPSAAVQPLPVPQAQLPGEQKMAAGGLASFAEGGANYLQGPTDGMADKLNTSIDDHQAAKLSHGEFVIPADVVSHLGNGNSDAGAQKLYDMMARIRKARTGNPEQGKRINPDKFMPGGLAKYAGGGAIAFAGPDGSVVPAPATTPASTTTTDVLSDWAGPAVSGMLSKGYAASNAPYQQYQGPLTAGASDMQQQAFAGAKDMAGAGYTPGQIGTSSFDTSAANQYMNPYLSASLDPQLKELQRQATINSMNNAGKLAQAGAYGGTRQAVMEGEENRNLLDKSQGLISSGYNTAYNNAMNQFNSDQNRNLTGQEDTEKSRQFAANNALDVNKNLANLGTTQRDIEQQGLTADKAAFEAQRDNPLKMAQYQKDLLTGLPITTTNKNVNVSDYAALQGKLNDLQKLYDQLNKP